jgi:hypothetical protein
MFAISYARHRSHSRRIIKLFLKGSMLHVIWCTQTQNRSQVRLYKYSLKQKHHSEEMIASHIIPFLSFEKFHSKHTLLDQVALH